MYVFEVVQYMPKNNEDTPFRHVGYMTQKFKTKQGACDYYNKNNPGLRKLTTSGAMTSSPDPVTKLCYIVRTDRHIQSDIHSFGVP